MNVGHVARFLGYAYLAVAIAMLAPMGLAASGGEMDAGPYLLGLVAALLFSGCCFGFCFGLPQRPEARGNFRELLLSLLLFWAVVPITAAIPFALSGVPFGSAWFEAVSAVTTTGGWLSDPAARATEAGMVYRASLQWLGGMVSIATAAAVFVRPEFVGVAPLSPPFARGEQDSYIRAFDRAVRALLPVMFGLATRNH